MRKIDLILENIRDEYMINLLEEGEVTELETLKTKKFLNESLGRIRKMLIEEGTLDGIKNHLANNWGKYLAGAGAAGLGGLAYQNSDEIQKFLMDHGMMDKTVSGVYGSEPTGDAGDTGMPDPTKLSRGATPEELAYMNDAGGDYEAGYEGSNGVIPEKLVAANGTAPVAPEPGAMDQLKGAIDKAGNAMGIENAENYTGRGGAGLGAAGLAGLGAAGYGAKKALGR
jgi:hypothetical protein